MKKIFIVLLVFASPWALSAQTVILNSWRDPNVGIHDPGVHKVIVAALLHDQGVRRQVEDYMVSLYPSVATQSYLLIGDSLVTDEAAMTQEFRARGFDGIAIIKQTNEETAQQYIPGQMPSYYHSWGGYWGWRGWGGPRWVTHYYPGTPDHVRNEWTWDIQVAVYSLVPNKLIYSANTSTTNPGGRVPLFEDVCNAVSVQMNAIDIVQ